MKRKPDLAILIGHALAKKGKAKGDVMSDEEDNSDSSQDEHMQQIADEMMDAIESKDSKALKDLLMEAIECMEGVPHSEGDSEESY